MNNKMPIKIWIDGKCFDARNFLEIKRTINDENAILNASDRHALADRQNYVIKLANDGRQVTSKFHLPSEYYMHLNTFREINLRHVELKTKTRLIIPSYGRRDMCITGSNESDVAFAISCIHSIIGRIREKIAVTHFISIPVLNEEIQNNFVQFKQEILNGPPIEGMHETIFQKSTKLHLTISVLVLLDDPEKAEAIAALTDCKSEIIDPITKTVGPLKIKVTGINCMNENLSKVNVLYANATIEHENGENILQHLADSISDFMYNRGLVRDYRGKVKLHVTLINTKYRYTPNDKNNKNFKTLVPFDARSIMEKYKEFYFGEVALDTVHLSCIGYQRASDGFYLPLFKIPV